MEQEYEAPKWYYIARCRKCPQMVTAWTDEDGGWGYSPWQECQNAERCHDKQPVPEDETGVNFAPMERATAGVKA